ncbi:MAG: hypothetical protein QXT77_08710 [Candidatus Methanomethylicaceae archaeon]
MSVPFFLPHIYYTGDAAKTCTSTNYPEEGPWRSYSPGLGLGCTSAQASLRECQLQSQSRSIGISDAAKSYIQSNRGSLNNESYLSLGQSNTASIGVVFSIIQGYRYATCGVAESAGSLSRVNGFKIDYSFYTPPGSQQKPPTGIFVIPPSISRKMSKPLSRKALAMSVAKAVPVVGYLSNLYDAAQLAQAMLDDAPKPNNLQAPSPPSGGLKLMLAEEDIEAIIPNGDNKNRQMPGVTFIDTDIVTNNLYQVTQIDWDSSSDVADISDTMKWLLEALARAAGAVLEAFGREFFNAMTELADIAAGVITDSQKAAGKILSAIAKEILAQLSDDGRDGLPEESGGSIDYELLAQAIRDGVSEALAEYEPPTPPAPPASETVISLSESLEEKLDQYFTIPDTEAGLAETISTNGFIFNPGYIP